MSYESHKYYKGNLYTNNAEDVKIQQLFMDLHASIIMDVKKPVTITKHICMYCNGYKKPTTIMRPICEYCNGYKKTSIYYETYTWVLQWL
jgi:hypothetical protein